MRGKKTALAIIILMLIGGATLNYFTPDYDVADDDQTQVTDGATANVK